MIKTINKNEVVYDNNKKMKLILSILLKTTQNPHIGINNKDVMLRWRKIGS